MAFFFKPKSLAERLAEEARELRNVAELLPPGRTLEKVLQKARRQETDARINKWLESPGLRPPT